jgi:hypothetical protein
LLADVVRRVGVALSDRAKESEKAAVAGNAFVLARSARK